MVLGVRSFGHRSRDFVVGPFVNINKKKRGDFCDRVTPWSGLLTCTIVN